MTRVFSARGSARIIGHRGGRGEGWPAENTIAAFERAHAEGALAVELDVRTCIGRDVIVMHDADLARMTDGMDRRSVAQLSLGELGRVRLGSAGERIPTLDALLEWARGKIALNIEAKHDVPNRLDLARSIARALARHPHVEVLLSSFDPTLLAMLAAVAPRVPRAWLTHEAQRRWEPAWAPLATRAPIHAIHLERTQADASTVRAFHLAGKRVGVWTVNDPREARDLGELGVDWLITDGPAALAQALTRT